MQEYILPVPDITIVNTEGEATYEVDLRIIHRILVKSNAVLGKCKTKAAFNFNCWRYDDDSLEDKVMDDDSRRVYYIAYGQFFCYQLMDSNHCSQEELKQFLAVVNYESISSMNDALPRTVTDWSSYRNLMMD